MKKRVGELATDNCARVGPKDRIYETVEKIAEDKETMLACVVDEEGILQGIISPTELLRAIEVREYGTTRYPFFEGPSVLHLLTSRHAEDIMSGPISVKADDEVEAAINIMLDEGFYEVPVTDEAGKLVGEISFFSIIAGSIDHLRSE